MAIFNLGKKKEEQKEVTCACSCGCPASETENITDGCSNGAKKEGIFCIKVLGAGCKSCHEQYENTKQAVKDMGLSADVEYVTEVGFLTPAF